MRARDRGFSRRLALVIAGALALTTGGCVDKTPPPLWPTPPPPPMATPIGVPVQAETAAPGADPAPVDDDDDDEHTGPQPGGIGPWQPESAPR